jgi:hypothetical protein
MFVKARQSCLELAIDVWQSSTIHFLCVFNASVPAKRSNVLSDPSGHQKCEPGRSIDPLGRGRTFVEKRAAEAEPTAPPGTRHPH